MLRNIDEITEREADDLQRTFMVKVGERNRIARRDRVSVMCGQDAPLPGRALGRRPAAATSSLESTPESISPPVKAWPAVVARPVVVARAIVEAEGGAPPVPVVWIVIPRAVIIGWRGAVTVPASGLEGWRALASAALTVVIGAGKVEGLWSASRADDDR